MAVAAAVPQARAQQPIKPDSSGYIAVNGVNYWFEIHGKGEPLLLLHGGLMSTQGFGPTLTTLGAKRRVIGVDLQGHGHTALGDRKIINPADIGRDLAVLVRKLGHSQVDVMGYSFGGIIAQQLAFQHPEVVRRLVILSAPLAERLVPRVASAAGIGWRRDGGGHEGHADVQVLRGRRAAPAGLPATARRHG
jgi:pimeloyl-ACP methyl ester carboxylesterase